MHAKPELRKATLRYMDVNKADVNLGWMQEAPAGMSKRELATQYGGYTEVLSRNDQYRTFVDTHASKSTTLAPDKTGASLAAFGLI
jgi:hypothetical protein